jgi:hypothetical protein
VEVGCRVEVGTREGVNDSRIRLVTVGVIVTKRRAVAVSEGGGWGVMLEVLVGESVAVGTNTVTTCSVSAAAVSRLETARSRMLIGSMVAKGM